MQIIFYEMWSILKILCSVRPDHMGKVMCDLAKLFRLDAPPEILPPGKVLLVTGMPCSGKSDYFTDKPRITIHVSLDYKNQCIAVMCKHNYLNVTMAVQIMRKYVKEF